jgi:PKD repeat protein
MKKAILYPVAIFLFLSSQSFAQDWSYVNSTGTTFILYGMSFPPGQSTVGYACGMQYTYDADGVIVKTLDGGNNWTQIWPASGSIDGLQGIWFTSDLVGFACGWNNYFIKTTDGGVTWTPVTVGTDVWYYRDVEFWDATNGIAIAVMNNTDDQACFITSNGGNTWAPSTSGMATADVMGVSYASQSVVYAVGTSANVYKSTDGGHNWTVSSTLSAMLLGVDFASTTFGVVGGEEKMFSTNNGGSSWQTYTTGYENFYATLSSPDGIAYVGGTDEHIYKTTNFGQSWAIDNSGSGSSSLYRIRKTANGALFACGSQGKILKWTPPLEADFTATPATVCTGGTVNFYDNSTGSIDSWAWVFESGTPGTSSQENPVITYNTPGTFDVQLTVTSGAFNSTEVKTNFITVYGALSGPATPSGPAEACGTYSYQYTTQNVQYAESYQWEVSPAQAGSITGDDIVGTFMASNTWSGTFSIRVRAENQCGTGPWSTDFTGTLYHNPVEFDLQGDGVYCEGDPGSEITLNGSETGVNYELFKDNLTTGMIVAGTGSAISFGLFTETGLYDATGFTANCSENMLGQIYVHMEPAPGQAGTPEGPTEVCSDESSQYQTAGASDADDYTWELEPAGAGILTPIGDQCSVAWDFNFSGTALLSVTGVNDCGTGDPSGELQVTVTPAPSPSVSGPGFVCDEEESVYTAAENNGSSYTWEVTGGEVVSGAGTWQVSIIWGTPGSGSVEVTETNSAGCESTSETLLVTIDDCTGIGEGTASRVRIYPNPASDNIHISGPQQADIRIYNLLGEEVLYLNSVSEEKDINISTFNKGLYLVKVEQAEEISVFQLIKK